MVFKINSVVAVWIECHQLFGGVQQIWGGNRFLGDFIDTGQQIRKFCLTVFIRLNLVNTVTICRPDFKHRICDRLSSICVMLIHNEIGTLLVFHGQRTGLAGE